MVDQQSQYLKYTRSHHQVIGGRPMKIKDLKLNRLSGKSIQTDKQGYLNNQFILLVFKLTKNKLL